MSALRVFGTGIQNSLDEWNNKKVDLSSLSVMVNAKRSSKGCLSSYLILIYVGGGYPVLLYFNVITYIYNK